LRPEGLKVGGGVLAVGAVRPLPTSKAVWMSAVSSPRMVRGGLEPWPVNDFPVFSGFGATYSAMLLRVKTAAEVCQWACNASAKLSLL